MYETKNLPNYLTSDNFSYSYDPKSIQDKKDIVNGTWIKINTSQLKEKRQIRRINDENDIS